MKTWFLASALLLAAICPGEARNFAVPAKDPTALITIPDTWTTEEIEYGYSAKSPDEDVFFSIEYAAGNRLDKMLALNDKWMADNKIKPKGKSVDRETKLGGLDAKVISYEATDGNGDTHVDFVLIPAGKGRVIMLTLWGSAEELEANKADVESIQKSVRAIN